MARRTASIDPIPAAPAPVLPRWLRQGTAGDPVEAAAFALAALAVLDPLALDAAPQGQLWRRRLALRAATGIAGLEGRREGEAQLRDAWVLRRPGEALGPAGRLLAGWRELGDARTLRQPAWAQRLPGYFDLPAAPLAPLLGDLAGRLPGRGMPLGFAALAAREVLALGPDHRGLCLWLADALLARALGWSRPVPLLATGLPRQAFRLEGEAWVAACAAGWGRAAVAAFDLQSDLRTRAEALRLAAPRLRGKDAGAVVAALMSEDALAAQAGARSSDRAARRLFERLTMLGLVRELTGRPSFRLYGV